MKGAGKSLLLVCLFGAALFPLHSLAQLETAKTVDTYIDRGGFEAFELDGPLNDPKDVIEKIYQQKGEYFEPNITVTTEGGTEFTGTVIQITGNYVVLLDQTRTGPRTTNLNALHVVERKEIVAVSAQILPRN